MVKKYTGFAWITLTLLATGCGGAPQGPHVRLASATAVEIETAQHSGDPVWYDFEPGDQVPMLLGVVGLFDAAASPPPVMIARRRFSVVIYPNGNTFFSIEGGGLISANQLGRWAIGFGAGPNGRGAAEMILMVGRPQDVPRD